MVKSLCHHQLLSSTLCTSCLQTLVFRQALLATYSLSNAILQGTRSLWTGPMAPKCLLDSWECCCGSVTRTTTNIKRLTSVVCSSIPAVATSMDLLSSSDPFNEHDRPEECKSNWMQREAGFSMTLRFSPSALPVWSSDERSDYTCALRLFPFPEEFPMR